MKNGNVYSKRKNKYLKQAINKYGYCKVTLQRNKHKKIFSVHRLVAKAFIPNPKNLPMVNHKDCNKANNNVNNLEWITAKDNTIHAILNGRFENMRKINSKKMRENNTLIKYQGYKKANEIRSKKVTKYDKNNNALETYKSISEASRKNNISIQSISYSANQKRKTGGGYIWRFV